MKEIDGKRKERRKEGIITSSVTEGHDTKEGTLGGKQICQITNTHFHSLIHIVVILFTNKLNKE